MKLHQGVYLPDGEAHIVEMMDKNLLLVDGRGTYQYRKFLAAMNHTKQFRVAVDCGAHCGLWSMQLAKKFDQVIAFEPVQKNAECFWANMKAINAMDRVELYMVALGEKTGYVTMDTLPDSSAASRVASYQKEYDEHKASMARLEDILAVQDVVDFIKIDTEGYELFVIRGAEETIKRCKPVMIVEQKGHGMVQHGFRKEEGIELLESWGMQRAVNMSGDWVLTWP